MPLEKTITNNILKYLKALPYTWCFKVHGGPYQSGIPDIIVCHHGRFYAFEVKNEKGKPTLLQENVIKNINKAEGRACIVRSVQDVIDAFHLL